MSLTKTHIQKSKEKAIKELDKALEGVVLGSKETASKKILKAIKIVEQINE